MILNKMQPPIYETRKKFLSLFTEWQDSNLTQADAVMHLNQYTLIGKSISWIDVRAEVQQN